MPKYRNNDETKYFNECSRMVIIIGQLETFYTTDQEKTESIDLISKI